MMVYQAAMLELHVQQHIYTLHQAGLAQALHETEMAAKRAANTEPLDAFAAAVLAKTQLVHVSNVGADAFHDIGSKRAWTEAWATLDRIVRRVEDHRKLDAYFVRMNTLARYNEAMGGDPQAFLARAKQYPGLINPMTVAFVVLTVATVLCWASRSPAVWMFGMFAFLTMLGSYQRVRQYLTGRRAEARAMAIAKDHAAFMAEDGVWLQGVWYDHPLLFDYPPEQLPQSVGTAMQAAVVSVREIERQVVVTRCKYCSKLTPVDAARCQSCGADGFGGAR